MGRGGGSEGSSRLMCPRGTCRAFLSPGSPAGSPWAPVGALETRAPGLARWGRDGRRTGTWDCYAPAGWGKNSLRGHPNPKVSFLLVPARTSVATCYSGYEAVGQRRGEKGLPALARRLEAQAPMWWPRGGMPSQGHKVSRAAGGGWKVGARGGEVESGRAGPLVHPHCP